MLFKKSIKQKICAAATAVILGLTLTTTPVSTVEAFGIGDAINVGITAASISKQRSAIKKQMNEINTTEEGQEMLFNTFKEKYGVNYDRTLNSRLDTIMTNLTNAVAAVDPSIREKPYKYFINNETSINAACSLAHVMMINTGTFEKILTDDEIAAVVGHEMGHGQKNHVYESNLKLVDKQMIASIGVAAAGGSVLSQLAGSIALMQANAHGVKKNEWEADNLSFEYMIHTNYNPGACAAIMQKFIEIMGSQKQSTAAKLLNPSDHPNSEARRDNYVKKLYEYSKNHVNAKNGTVIVNGKTFIATADTSTMSGAERSYFVLGNLAAAYHNGHDKSEAKVQDGTVYLGSQPIITPAGDDESAQVLADRLNSIK